MNNIGNNAVAQLRVVLDTNAIYAHFPSLFSRAIKEKMREIPRPGEMVVKWYIPEITLLERTYQLRSEALELFPHFRKFRQLMQTLPDLEEADIDERVAAIVSEGMTAINIELLQLDYGTVDWKRLMGDAANRLPPFSPGEIEKGFRDALLLETFVQLVAASSDMGPACRVVLVTSDNLLIEAAIERCSRQMIAHEPCRPENLGGLINTLREKLDEELAKHVTSLAKDYFYNPVGHGTDAGLISRLEVVKLIEAQYGTKLAEVPLGAQRRANGQWIIDAPQFQRREDLFWIWTSQVTVPYIGLRRVQVHTPPSPSYYTGLSGTVSPLNDSSVSPLSGSVAFPTSGSVVFPMSGSVILPPSGSSIYSGASGTFYNYPNDPQSNYGQSQPIGSTIDSYGSWTTVDGVVGKGRTVFQVDWKARYNEQRSLDFGQIVTIRLL